MSKISHALVSVFVRGDVLTDKDKGSVVSFVLLPFTDKYNRTLLSMLQYNHDMPYL